MQSEDKKNIFLLSFGSVLFLMALFSTDLNDLSFEHNLKAYFKIGVSVLIVLLGFYRIQKKKKETPKN
jgi:hypothetical protein